MIEASEETKKFTLRISSKLKSEIDKRAKELGVSSNTFIKIILHKYVNRK